MRKLILKAPYQLEMTTDKSPEPKDNEVRIFVKKIGICGSDPTIYKGLHPYVSYPLVMGHELSQKWVEGKTPKKVIIVPKKIVNVVL